MMRTMSRRLKITLALECVLFVSLLAFIARPDTLVQLLLILTILTLSSVWLSAIGEVFRSRDGQTRSIAVAVLLLAPAAWAGATFLGGWLRDYYFLRDLPRMQEVVQMLSVGGVAIDRGQPVGLPGRYDSLAYAIRAERYPNQELMVTFYVGAGFPVKHLAYVFCSDDRMTLDMRREWSRADKKRTYWYEVSD